ncbi:cation:H+ antiporter [Halogranum amylolyticum]|uniref:Cation:H+ antiporter n=1 Tax=Halogranum amylolyticum TaxID=660520 RepID=A0A1H8TK62_9EURY|nr:sodium:calcium antiporter [Halogranum amylolyticum]SEO90878.1 cation:H+ antiporter [Halogranum amylolyticum]
MLELPSTLVALVVFLVGVVLVVESVETFVESVAEAALGLGVSAFFLTVLLAGTDLENAILGLAAVTGGLPGVALGTVFGEALFVLGAAVGIAGLLRPFEVAVPRIYQLLTLGSPALMVVLSADGLLSRLDGALLVVAFLPFVGAVYWLESDTDTQFLAAESFDAATEDDDLDLEGLAAVAVPLLAVVGMTVGSELAVVGARDLLAAFGIPGLAFGATVVSFVASLEELFLTVEPVRQGNPHLGVGNVIGSTAFFVTANAGVIALVRPIDVSGSVVSVHWPFLLVLLVAVVALLARGRVDRPAGALLLVGYAAYWGATYLL